MDGHDLRNAYHDEAVEVIRQAKNPVRFVVKSMSHSVDTAVEIDNLSNVSMNNPIDWDTCVVTSVHDYRTHNLFFHTS